MTLSVIGYNLNEHWYGLLLQMEVDAWWYDGVMLTAEHDSSLEEIRTDAFYMYTHRNVNLRHGIKTEHRRPSKSTTRTPSNMKIRGGIGGIRVWNSFWVPTPKLLLNSEHMTRITCSSIYIPWWNIGKMSCSVWAKVLLSFCQLRGTISPAECSVIPGSQISDTRLTRASV